MNRWLVSCMDDLIQSKKTKKGRIVKEFFAWFRGEASADNRKRKEKSENRRRCDVPERRVRGEDAMVAETSRFATEGSRKTRVIQSFRSNGRVRKKIE